LALAAACAWIWSQARLKNWDRQAIAATFDGLEEHPDEDRLVVIYVLHNRSGRDYRLSGTKRVEFMTRLKEPPSLIRDDLNVPPNEVKPVVLEDLPLFIPAGESVPFHVWLWYPYLVERADGTASATAKSTPMNCAGFVLFDEEAKYRIDMPAGW
jgi:hypothetical protein